MRRFKRTEETMLSQTPRFAWIAAAIVGSLTMIPTLHAEDEDPAALAAAPANVPTTLEKGLQTSERTGQPISAKFEIEEGKLRLSVYTVITDGYNEVVVAPDAGNVIKADKITDADDLKAAAAQKAAMEKASTSLIAATDQALRENAGSSAVSIFPELKNGHPVASVTLLRKGRLTTVSEKLD
jgi:hypothetical protein